MAGPAELRLDLSLLLAAAVAGTAAHFKLLTRSGAVAACLVGAPVLHFGGAPWAFALGVFFVSGSMLTRVGHDRKTQPEQRHGGRTATQVLCTGGVAAAVSVLWGLRAIPTVTPWLPAAFLGSLAAATADTWGTEVGMLSRTPPRSIVTGEVVPPGQSGGVTTLGSAGTVAGALAVAIAGLWIERGLFLPVTVAGIAAGFADSVLGATVQGSYRRPDGSPSDDASEGAHVGGWTWLGNSGVNLAITSAGAIVAAALAALMSKIP